MIDHSDRNLRVLEYIEPARILSQLYAANQVECTKNDASRNSSRNDQCFVGAAVHSFNEKAVFFDPFEIQLVGVLANPTRCFGCSHDDFRAGDGLRLN